MRALWLADVLRAAGLEVIEHAGWRTRGFEPWEPRWGIVHATAAPRSQSDAVQVAIVRDGHSKLAGPIANAVVDRAGRWHVVASGRCNTARVGWAGPAGGVGNAGLLGVEACNDNVSEPWPSVQYEAYITGWAAICTRMGWSAARAIGHKEHQPGDKSDPTFNMDMFRSRIAAAMKEGDMADLSERVPPEASVARSYPGIRADGFRWSTWVQYTYRWARRAAGRWAGKVLPNSWMAERWEIPDDGYSRDTYLRSGYGHSRRGADNTEVLLEGQAKLAAEQATMRELLRQLLEQAGSPVDMDQVAAAALAGAQQAMAQLDVRIVVSPAEEPTGGDVDPADGDA